MASEIENVEWNGEKHHDIARALIKDMIMNLVRIVEFTYKDKENSIDFYCTIVSNFCVNAMAAITNFEDKNGMDFYRDNIKCVVDHIYEVSEKLIIARHKDNLNG